MAAETTAVTRIEYDSALKKMPSISLGNILMTHFSAENNTSGEQVVDEEKWKM